MILEGPELINSLRSTLDKISTRLSIYLPDAQARDQTTANEPSQPTWTQEHAHTGVPTTTPSDLMYIPYAQENNPLRTSGALARPARGSPRLSTKAIQSVSFEQSVPASFSGSSSTSYSTPHVHHPTTRTNVDSLAIQQLDPYYGMRSLAVVEGHWDNPRPPPGRLSTPSHVAAPEVWTTPRYPDEQSYGENGWGHYQEPALRDTPAAAVRVTSPSASTIAEGRANTQGSHYYQPLQQLLSGGFSHLRGGRNEISRTTDIFGGGGLHPYLSASGAQKKRKRELEPFSTRLERSKRRVEHIKTGTSSILEPDATASQTSGIGFFQNAQNFVLKDSNVVGAQHVYIESSDRSPNALLWLKEYTMTGAEYDYSVRSPPPRCHPGTRATIIEKIFCWLRSPQRKNKLCWLYDPAGVGKSAVVQTLAERLSKTQRLGASLFFCRLSGRTNPLQVLPTLAYRFAVQDPSYRAYITEVMLADPRILEKAMGEQFEILIVEPFASEKARSGKGSWVVAIDGLDECSEDPGGKRHSDRVQSDVVRLISNFIRKYPTAPLMWKIASRPETHLRAVFSEVDILPSVWVEEIPAGSTEACQDVERFLHQEFMKIRQNYPDHIQETPWPTSDQFSRITNAALGLFIFAEVIVRFIDDASVGNPIGQLERVFSAISKMPIRNQENPLVDLDAVYAGVLSKIPSSLLQVTKRLIGSFICLELHHVDLPDCDLRQTCNYLEISRDSAVTALRYLHSVLYFHKAEDIGRARPRFYHNSFRNFLEDPSRSHEYFIDREEAMNELFQGIIRTARTRFSSRPPPPPFWPGNDEPKTFQDFINDSLYSVFKGDMSSDGVYTTFHDMRFFLPNAEFQLLLENISAVELAKYSLETVGLLIDIPRLSMNKPREVTLRELSRRGFLTWITFGSLSVDWECVSISVARPHSWVRTVQVVETDSPSISVPDEDALILREFRIYSKAASQPKAMVFGHKESEYCLVIHREDLRDVWTATTPIVHLFITGILLVLGTT